MVHGVHTSLHSTWDNWLCDAVQLENGVRDGGRAALFLLTGWGTDFSVFLPLAVKLLTEVVRTNFAPI